MNEIDIPIDIHAGKLQDWLVSRHHVKKDWQKSILPIREKINNAIRDMPIHDEITKLLTGSHINYFHCVKIIEILKDTEADTKTLFGGYKSQRMKEWQEILKMYQKDNINLAEAAQILTRNITYEIPSLKKQISKLEQTQSECDKKIADYKKREIALKSEFSSVCKQIGIAGNKIKSELVEKLNELPDIYTQIGKNVSNLKKPIDLYTSFTTTIVNEELAKSCLPMLKYIVEYGNTTVYQWKYGEAPLSIRPDQLDIKLDVEEEKDNDQIDFGDEGEMEIDFGDTPAADGEIDWGSSLDEQEDTTLGEDALNVSLEESGIVVESDGTSGGIATGKEALTLLDNPETRTKFIDELIELEAFLKMRLYEAATDGNFNSFIALQDLAMESSKSIANMAGDVQLCIGEMMDKRIEHLHHIKHSPQYVDTLSSQLKQKLVIAGKMNTLIETTRLKKKEANEQCKELPPALNLIVQRTKELQLEIQEEISIKYKGRPVNIIGGANANFL